jgi:uncharacterized membrane protein YccC
VAAAWVRAKDPGLLAVKRSVRAAVVMPTAFAVTHTVFSDAQVSLFAAFGSFALLLLADFPGRPRTRLVSFLALFAVGACFIALGTVVSTHKVAAVATMGVVAFVVLFAGIAAPQVATGATAALLTFVLPVAVAQPAAATGPRLLGWVFAGALCIPACLLVWPTPWHDELRRRLSATVSAIGHLAAAHAEGRRDPAANAEVTEQLGRLRIQFAATPYPPTGAAPGAIGLAKLVGRVEWVAGNAGLVGEEPPSLALVPVREVSAAVAETLAACASLVCDGTAHPVDDPARVQAVRESARRLDGLIGRELDAEITTLISTAAGPVGAARSGDPTAGEAAAAGRRLLSSLDPSYHARALGVATEMVAGATLESAGASPPIGPTGGLADEPGERRQFWRLVASHLSLRSVWFRNALRGAVGLALAVAVVEVTNVNHGFWVVLGTLSVLRSNALGTGSSALRAVGGTVVGFAVGSAIMIGVGDHSALLWALLPVAVLVSGVAPSMISFAAGQAGFTVVVVILFNLIAPTGWLVGLTRIEDVAIGCGVSVVVGLLFWPRGATEALGRALSDTFVKSSTYLSYEVERLTTTTDPVDTALAERAAHAAYSRLDDAFRQFIAERGAKVVPVETVSSLFTGANRIRLGAYTLGTLRTSPAEPGRDELESVTLAGAVLRDSCASSHRWYEEFAEVLADRRPALPPPPEHDETLHHVLRAAFDDARARHRPDRLRTALHMLWADELLESQRQLQVDLAASADLFARRRHEARLI